MTQTIDTRSRPGGQPHRVRAANYLVAALLGALVAVPATLWLGRGAEFPQQVEVTGTIQGYSLDKESLVIDPDGSDPTTSYHVTDPAFQHFAEGDRVQLTVIEVSDHEEIVVAVALQR
jgi:hypothetical protein